MTIYDGRATNALTQRPQCNFCDDPAVIDGKTRVGPWGYMCMTHYVTHGLGTGDGCGQFLLCGDGVDELLIELLTKESDVSAQGTQRDDSARSARGYEI